MVGLGLMLGGHMILLGLVVLLGGDGVEHFAYTNQRVLTRLGGRHPDARGQCAVGMLVALRTEHLGRIVLGPKLEGSRVLRRWFPLL